MTLEEYLKSLSKAPGKTESDMCDNAETAVRKAIAANQKLSALSIKVAAQGSYANRTNVKEDSDVDVYVRCDDAWYYDLPFLVTPAKCGINVLSEQHYVNFKDEVERALRAHFKQGHVTRGRKAFDIKENTYRIAADVVPCFEYRRYGAANLVVARGTAFVPDNGTRIVNWPDQNYANGVSKNTATGQRFKDVVRILKRLRNQLDSDGNAAAKPIPSFFIECAVWNADNWRFGNATYTEDVRSVLVFLFNNTVKPEDCSGWNEVNGEKKLFEYGQPWTYIQAHSFFSAVWDYLGFK